MNFEVPDLKEFLVYFSGKGNAPNVCLSSFSGAAVLMVKNCDL